jgi:hypothetical protein
VTRVIEVPAHFDDRSFDQFAAGFGQWPPEEKLLVDARGAQWASPYGLIGMLTAGQALAEANHERPLLTIPLNDEVKRYWARVGFFAHAAEVFELHGRVPKAAASGPSDVLLDVTPVRAMEDVHRWSRRSARPRHGYCMVSWGWSAARSDDSVWRFRNRARILWSTPGPAAGWRSRYIHFAGVWAAGSR